MIPRVIFRIIGIIVLSCLNLSVHAAKPIFSIIPITSTVGSIPSNGGTLVQYQVTNQTAITRTLTMKPIPGVTQSALGPNACTNPFTLAPNQSCILSLSIFEAIHGGPVICKTQCANNNNPDLFLCAQASPENQLNFTKSNTPFVPIQSVPLV